MREEYDFSELVENPYAKHFMKYKHKYVLGQIWLLLSAYGICFAVLSSIEEALQGNYWKTVGACVLGITVYLTLAKNKKE